MKLPASAEIAVVGAGTMGAGIARVAAAAGHRVLVYDLRDGAAARALDAVRADLERRVERGSIARAEADALLARLHVVPDLDGLSGAALVVEAIVEQRDAKVALFRALEAVIAPEAILATNTSSISVTAIGGALERPERCVGMHFFNPAHVMKLVEVVAPVTASAVAVETVVDTAEAWGKTVIRVRSTPGFVVNRVARPFYAEALRTTAEFGTACAGIDAAMTECGGFRMGPFRLMDLVGNDVNNAVTRSVFEAFAYDRRFAPSLVQQELVDAGRFGRKSGRGFYDYAGEAPQAPAVDAPPGPTPAAIVAHGDLGVAEPLLELARARGIAVERAASTEPYIAIDGLALQLTDGALASEHDRRRPTALFDLAFDYAACERIVVATGVTAPPQRAAVAAGFFQTLGKRVTAIGDMPGLIVMRTVSALANEASTLLAEEVGAATIDLAMTLGVNYPLGPLAWGERIGWPAVLTVLDNLGRLLGPERYRPAHVLRARALGATA